MSDYRVSTAAQSFDLEQFVRIDKDGNEVWRKEAYCRNRRDLMASLRARDLPLSLADGVPGHHAASYEALADFAKKREISDEHKAKMLAGRRL